MNSYKLTSNLFTVVWPIHTLPQFFFVFFLGNNRPFSDTWVIFFGQFYGCVFHVFKGMVLLKMDPQLEAAVEVHPFSQTNMKFEPLSLLLTSTQSLHFHTWNSWIYSVNNDIKRFAEIQKPWFITILCFTHPPKSKHFSSPQTIYHSWWENMMVKERNWD